MMKRSKNPKEQTGKIILSGASGQIETVCKPFKLAIEKVDERSHKTSLSGQMIVR